MLWLNFGINNLSSLFFFSFWKYNNCEWRSFNSAQLFSDDINTAKLFLKNLYQEDWDIDIRKVQQSPITRAGSDYSTFTFYDWVVQHSSIFGDDERQKKKMQEKYLRVKFSSKTPLELGMLSDDRWAITTL